MALYLDSANLSEATHAAQTGWVNGITTNPAILTRSEFTPEEVFTRLSQLAVKKVFYQVSSNDLMKMADEAEKAKEILEEKLVVKIPPTEQGFRFAAKVSGKFTTCITAIFNPAQALVAREIKSKYIAIYVNRATQLIGDGISLTGTIANMLKDSSTEIIAASLKSKEEGVAAFQAGAHHLTLPYDLLNSLIDDPHSSQAVNQFDQFQTHF